MWGRSRGGGVAGGEWRKGLLRPLPEPAQGVCTPMCLLAVWAGARHAPRNRKDSAPSTNTSRTSAHMRVRAAATSHSAGTHASAQCKQMRPALRTRMLHRRSRASTPAAPQSIRLQRPQAAGQRAANWRTRSTCARPWYQGRGARDTGARCYHAHSAARAFCSATKPARATQQHALAYARAPPAPPRSESRK